MDFNKIGQAAAASEDMSQDKVFERELPAAGVAFLRLVGYVETGRHESKNVTHKPALKAILVWELSHPRHLIEVDGKKVPQIMYTRTNKGVTATSGFRKLFNVLNLAYGGKNTHMAEFLGKPFLGKVYHSVPKQKGDPVYANLDLNGAWSMTAPEQENALTGEVQQVPIPEAVTKPFGFLWENESVTDKDIEEMWESIYIDGFREVEDKATKTKVQKSKNWMQETIMQNIEWEGSRTQALTQSEVVLDQHLTAPKGSIPFEPDSSPAAQKAEPVGDSNPLND